VDAKNWHKETGFKAGIWPNNENDRFSNLF